MSPQVRVGFTGPLPSQVHVLHIAYGIMPFRSPERHFFIGKIQGAKGKAECCTGKVVVTKAEGLNLGTVPKLRLGRLRGSDAFGLRTC